MKRRSTVNGKMGYSLKSRGCDRADPWERKGPPPSPRLLLSLEPGAVFREERKSTQIPQKELFWQGLGLPPTAASSSLLPSSIHL